MLRTLRNLIVNIMASFIRNKEARHQFRNKYKRKSKFRKLRDDNKRLFNENQVLRNEIFTLKTKELKDIKQKLLKMESLLFSVSNIYTGRPRVYLSIVSIVYNEGPYLKEWIEYHKLVGVERFYLYDNGSDDDTLDVLQPYISDGLVVYYKANGYIREGLQIAIYNDAICKYRYETFWLALIDIDEFLVPVEEESMTEALKYYEKYPALGINWVCFDSNGHKTKPKTHGGLVTANYTRVNKEYDIKVNRIIKSIVNPARVMYVVNPHYVTCSVGSAVNENYETINGMHTKHHSSSRIRINHYITKSNEEFMQRSQNQEQHAKRDRISAIKSWGGGFEQDFTETTEDIAIQKYLPKLKQSIGIQD